MAGRGRRTCSTALLEAQEQLQQLRQQFQASQDISPPGEAAHGRCPECLSPSPGALPTLPNHLGWNSTELTTAVRAAQERRTREEDRKAARSLAWLPKVSSPKPAPQPSPPPRGDENIKLYPDIALGLLREEQVAAGRIWLLLHHIDRPGRGWVAADQARAQLTKKDAVLRVCGWRQLRKLLARGDGLFWERTKDRLWLRSAARVAATLGIYQLIGQPVALPVHVLLQPIGTVRAHFYASFHSSRIGQPSRPPVTRPIARATLRQLSRVSRRTQRAYEIRAAVRRHFNFAIGSKYTVSEAQDRAWKQGGALFRLTDSTGRLGKRGIAYTAWQLPNNYIGPHQQCSRGQQKRINRVLADLFMKGMTGNGKNPTSDATHRWRRRFYDNGLRAAVSYNRSPNEDVYWPNQQRSHSGKQIWHLLPGQPTER